MKEPHLEEIAGEQWQIGPEEGKKYEAIFFSLNPVNGKLTGDQCRPVLLNSQLPNTYLAKVTLIFINFVFAFLTDKYTSTLS